MKRTKDTEGSRYSAAYDRAVQALIGRLHDARPARAARPASRSIAEECGESIFPR